MILLLPLFLAASLPAPECHAVDSASVQARDLARFIPEFQKLPPDFLFGYVQESGAPRIFKSAELQRIAHNRGLELASVEDICFARRTFIPDSTQIAEAMRKELSPANAKIEVLESNQHPVPFGQLVFPRSAVQGAGLEITWRGYVQSADGAKFPVTARARITATLNRVIASADLQPRKPITSAQLRVEAREESPFDEDAVRDLDHAAGFVAKMRIGQDTPLRKSQIERPMDVAYGDVVRVDVFDGAAHLILEGRAETAGMTGSLITVRNPASGQSFRASVAGKDRVVVGAGLP